MLHKNTRTLNMLKLSTPKMLAIAILSLFVIGCNSPQNKDVVTLQTLLNEMVSVEESARYPDPYYSCLQESSYDRRSVSPNLPHWFANSNDGYGIIRTDTVDSRIEKVLFDDTGAGVITRIWITTINKKGTWRFYFDGSTTPGWIIPAYDLMQIGIPSLGKGMLQAHTSYEPEGKGGNTLFLPIPYAKGCKVTFEDGPGVEPTPKYYQINYRKYAEGAKVETFSEEVVKRNSKKIAEVDNLLLNPKSKQGKIIADSKTLASTQALILDLPAGENSVYEINFSINIKDSSQYAQQMRDLVFCAQFDGKETVWVPLSDFSGGGMGAPYLQSWFLSADGKGNITSRWLMPYQKSGTLKLINTSNSDINVKMEANVSPLNWDKRSLYFYASWRQERQIYVHDCFFNNLEEDEAKCIEWNFATIKGKGVYKGDLLSLFNYAPAWYGEGDEKIWVDNDTFPSHFGTGTEDYYNSSWAPVVPYQTPFGGAPRADTESSTGYNAYFRTRNLDGIPFKEKFKFDLEMLGWQKGYADYATTIYWYGDFDAQAIGTSGEEELKHRLLPTPEDPSKYKIGNSIEFESLAPTSKSESIRYGKQNMSQFVKSKWSKAGQLIFTGGKKGDYAEFTFDKLDKKSYQIVLHATKASDYGIITFMVNNKPSTIKFDGYNKEVINSKVDLGIHTPIEGKIDLRINLIGTNPSTKVPHFLFGLDCIEFIEK